MAIADETDHRSRSEAAKRVDRVAGQRSAVDELDALRCSRSWEDKTTGAKQRTVELNARSITIIGDAGGGKPDADDPDFDFN